MNRRAALAKEVASLKRQAGLSLLDAAREEQILSRLLGTNTGPLDDDSVASIFRGILRASRRVQLEIVRDPGHAT